MRIIGLLKADEPSDARILSTKELLENMGRFVEELTSAVMPLAADGLKPSSKGGRANLFELWIDHR